MSIAPTTQGLEKPNPGEQVDRQQLLYLRSYLLTRAVIGFVGLGLPIALLVGDGLFLDGEVPRRSLSYYYNTGMRDVFVGGLCMIGLFLITYLFFQYTWDNLLSILAGVAAFGVALIPTSADGRRPLTPIQERFGENQLATVHFGCAVVFIGALAVISFLFGIREGRRLSSARVRRHFWRWFHWSCAFAILAAVGYIFLTKGLRTFDAHSTFYGETVAVFAFGASWLTKGLELEWLLNRHPRPAREVLAEEAPEVPPGTQPRVA